MKASRLLTSLHLIGFRAEVEAAMRLRLQRMAVPEIARRAGFAPRCAPAVRSRGGTCRRPIRDCRSLAARNRYFVK
jgi:hypothetical protein